MSIDFKENSTMIKGISIDENHIINYSYSLDFIRKNNDHYSLYRNFKNLFEYVDPYNRINLVSKVSQMGLLETKIGMHSQNEYI